MRLTGPRWGGGASIVQITLHRPLYRLSKVEPSISVRVYPEGGGKEAVEGGGDV